MLRANIGDVKAHFSAFIERVERGETVLVCRRNEPVAELRSIGQRAQKRVLGRPVAGLHVPESFFDPLPEGLEQLFSGDER
jgi:prevent-host-death family protein